MNWTRPEIISALALLVAALSFAVSGITLWRAAAAEKPIAWLEIQPVNQPDCWVATIHLRNQSRVELSVESALVDINEFPVGKKQNFLLGDYDAARKTDDAGKIVLNLGQAGRHLKLGFATGNTASPGESIALPVLLFRGAMSAAKTVKIIIFINSMGPTKRRTKHVLRYELHGAGLTFNLS